MSRRRNNPYRRQQRIGEAKAGALKPRSQTMARCPFRRLRSKPGHLPRRYWQPCGGRLRHRMIDAERVASCKTCGREYVIVNEATGKDGVTRTEYRMRASDGPSEGALRR